MKKKLMFKKKLFALATNPSIAIVNISNFQGIRQLVYRRNT